MPSRKRNKGKQRKAKAASAATSASCETLLQLSGQDGKLAQLINNLSLKKCDHGRPTLADGDACKIFKMEFERALILPNDDKVVSLFNCVCEALLSAADSSHFPSNGNEAKYCLLAIGTDFLLEAVHSNNEQKQKDILKQACAVALAYVLCENSSDALQQEQIGANPVICKRIGDLLGGGMRETVSFFAKRLDCSCLKEMYKQVKGEKKTAKCLHCCQFKERKTLMLCSGCKIAQYCCAKCQKDDWPEHKNDCRTGYIRV